MPDYVIHFRDGRGSLEVKYESDSCSMLKPLLGSGSAYESHAAWIIFATELRWCPPDVEIKKTFLTPGLFGHLPSVCPAVLSVPGHYQRIEKVLTSRELCGVPRSFAEELLKGRTAQELLSYSLREYCFHELGHASAGSFDDIIQNLSTKTVLDHALEEVRADAAAMRIARQALDRTEFDNHLLAFMVVRTGLDCDSDAADLDHCVSDIWLSTVHGAANDVCMKLEAVRTREEASAILRGAGDLLMDQY